MAKSFPNTGATVIDSAADLPAASAALEGILMFQKDTNELKICDGASWVSVVDTDTPPGLTLINKTTFSNAATTTIDSIFTTAYESYRLVISANSSSAASAFQMQMRTAGSTISTAGWYTAGLGRNTAGTAWNDAQAGAATAILGYVSWAGYEQSGIVADLIRPQVAGFTSYTSQAAWISGGGQATMASYGGIFGASNQFDGFVLSTAAGNASGVIRVYGYRNS